MDLFDDAAHWIATGIEMLGIAVIVAGGLIASMLFPQTGDTRQGQDRIPASSLKARILPHSSGAAHIRFPILIQRILFMIGQNSVGNQVPRKRPEKRSRSIQAT